MPKSIYQMVAVAKNGVIGRNRKLPWRIAEEWDYFIRSTAGGVMVMGRVCAEEFGAGKPDRDMIAISHNEQFKLPGFLVAHSVEEAIRLAQASPRPGPIWICGGEQIYEETFAMSDKLYISLVHREFEGDTYFPENWREHFPHELFRQDRHNDEIPFSICVYGKAPVALSIG